MISSKDVLDSSWVVSFALRVVETNENVTTRIILDGDRNSHTWMDSRSLCFVICFTRNKTADSEGILTCFGLSR